MNPASAAVALAARGLHRGRAGAGPLRHGPAGWAPGGDAVGVRAPVPADRRAMPTDRRARLRGLGPALGVVLPRLPAAVGRHVEQAEGPVDRLVAPAGRGVGEEHAVALAQETDDVPHLPADPPFHTPHRVPGLGVAHDLDVRSHLVPRARGQDGERDPPGIQVDGVPHVPGRGGAALALHMVRRAIVPHVLVDHELVATLEQIDERDRPVDAGDLDRAVELDHRQPPPGRGDRVALARVGLLADQQLFARRLPGGQVDDGRLAGKVAARAAGCSRHGVLRCTVSCPWGLLGARQPRRLSAPGLIAIGRSVWPRPASASSRWLDEYGSPVTAPGLPQYCRRTRQTPGRRTERSRVTDTKSPGGRTADLGVAVREGPELGNEVAEAVHTSTTSENKSWPRTPRRSWRYSPRTT